jgi:stage II sporulation protein AA (anti-sigma F factor antagonist)
MEIHTQQTDSILVVTLEGELDAYWAEEAERELWACLEQGHYRLVLDLSKLAYLSSAGLRVLLRFYQRITSLGGELLLAAPQPFVQEVLETSGFDRTLPVFGAVDQALAVAEEKVTEEDAWATAEVYNTPAGIFRFRPTLTPGPSPWEGEGKARLRVIGQADDFLYSRASLERLTTLDLSDLGYMVGVGALGEPGPTVLDRLGELVSVPGAVYWLPGDGRQVPDFLIGSDDFSRPGTSATEVATTSPTSNLKLPVHLLYALTLEGPYQFYGHFTAADQEAGTSLDDLTRELLAWAEQGSKALGVVLRADVAGLWGVGLKRSPRAEHAPANGQKISHRENIKDWLHFPTEPAYANHTLLAVGVLTGGEQENTSAHLHGAVFHFVPELGGDHGLEAELDRVVQQGELVSVAHLLPNTRLPKALFGLWMVEDVERETQEV